MIRVNLFSIRVPRTRRIRELFCYTLVMFIDTHAHLQSAWCKPDQLDSIIERAVKAGVKRIIVVGTDLESSKEAIELCAKFPMIRATVGIHPGEVKNVTDDDLHCIEELARDPACVAVGEIGLDYHYGRDQCEKQKDIFIQCLEIALKVEKPVVIHSRDAHDEAFAILRNWAPRSSIKYKGQLHCYAGTPEMAKQYVVLGFMISFTGIITFPQAKSIHEVCKALDPAHMLIETDAPYLAPVPYRGKPNEPAYVRQVAMRIAEIKNLSLEQIKEITSVNAQKLFHLL